ncbi:MAG TPA: hypothetical protein VGO16_01970 [Pseudonocardiaceae bacterium]|jgi:hypothetical protein|nr:hypothetical protein [Pseudonocardiaceae bacterium]
MSWTVELRWIDEAALAGPAVEWICSGVPTQQPAPEHQTADLLGERGLLLFPADPVESPPRARSRRLIGYVTRDPEVMRVARLLANASDDDTADESRVHPMVLTARWVQGGYSADAAASWVAAGVTSPEAARTLPST